MNIATFFGQLALISWGFSACIICHLGAIPSYQLLTCLFFVGSVMCFIVNTYNNSWYQIKAHPWFVILFSTLAFVGNDIFYIKAFEFAPAAHIDLIISLWPFMVMIFLQIFLRYKYNFKYLLGGLFSLCGLFVLFYQENISDFGSLEGYIYAFCCILLWSIYIVIGRQYGIFASELIFIYCFFGLIFSFYMSKPVALWVDMDPGIIPWVVFMGIVTHGANYFAWDYAVKKGNIYILTIFGYFVPVISVAGLIMFGFASFSYGLILSMFLIVFGSVLAAGEVSKMK